MRAQRAQSRAPWSAQRTSGVRRADVERANAHVVVVFRDLESTNRNTVEFDDIRMVHCPVGSVVGALHGFVPSPDLRDIFPYAARFTM